MKIKEKIHERLQEKALNKAILNTIGDIGNYFIFENSLMFELDENKLKLLDELDFYLPSWQEVVNYAKNIYPKFDEKVANKIFYNIQKINLEKDLKITAIDSDINFGFNEFTNIDIKKADKVKIKSSTVKKGNLNINANDIEIERFNMYLNGDINLNSPILSFKEIYLLVVNNMNINSKMVEFNNTSIYTNNINLKSDLIITENSKLKAVDKINIIDKNLDAIEGVEASEIIYNGQDITFSDSIVKPKLRNILLCHLREIRNEVTRNINTKLEESTMKQRKNLNNKPITKVLKK